MENSNQWILWPTRDERPQRTYRGLWAVAKRKHRTAVDLAHGARKHLGLDPPARAITNFTTAHHLAKPPDPKRRLPPAGSVVACASHAVLAIVRIAWFQHPATSVPDIACGACGPASQPTGRHGFGVVFRKARVLGGWEQLVVLGSGRVLVVATPVRQQWCSQLRYTRQQWHSHLLYTPTPIHQHFALQRAISEPTWPYPR